MFAFREVIIEPGVDVNVTPPPNRSIMTVNNLRTWWTPPEMVRHDSFS